MSLTLNQLQGLIRDTYDAKDRRRGVAALLMRPYECAPARRDAAGFGWGSRLPGLTRFQPAVLPR